MPLLVKSWLLCLPETKLVADFHCSADKYLWRNGHLEIVNIRNKWRGNSSKIPTNKIYSKCKTFILTDQIAQAANYDGELQL